MAGVGGNGNLLMINAKKLVPAQNSLSMLYLVFKLIWMLLVGQFIGL